MVTACELEEALKKVHDQASFIQHLLSGALRWEIKDRICDLDDIAYEWSGDELRAAGLDKHVVAGRIRQLQPLVANQPWGIFLLEFKNPDAFTAGRGMAGPLRKVLRGLVPSRRRAAHLAAWNREDILFICTHNWQHYSFVHFTQPTDQARPARLTRFGWGPDSSNRTLLEYNLPHLEWPDDPSDAPEWRAKWLRAFDKEKMTAEYFRELKTIYGETLVPDLLKSLKDKGKAKHAALILLNRLLFLCFVQKKGWLDNQSAYLAAAFWDYRSKPDGTGFYTQFLWPLFEALALPNEARPDHRFDRIPFLNGGLFEPQTTISDGDLKITNATFRRLFDDLLERYNFTVTEDTPLDIEVAVDPEMLGKIFEELVTGSSETYRHDTGAYYTPRPVVSFMCREALKGYLGNGAVVERFVDEHDACDLKNPEAVLEKLRTVRICDPACGSGAYLVGMLHELVALRQCLFVSRHVDPIKDYNRKLEIIQNNLYGVDKDETAVSIARLRLWLSLAVEFEGDTPDPLPNLDFKIEQGDSLICPDPGNAATDMFRYSQIEKFADLKARYLREPYNKAPIFRQIDVLRREIAEWVHPAATEHLPFDWAVDFAEIFLLGQSHGFDIVLANPPYVRQELIRPMKPRLKEIYPAVYTGTADLFTYFFARSLQLLRSGGLMVFICSSTWTKTASAGRLRGFLRDRTTVRRFLDFGDLQLFEKVTTYPAVIAVEKSRPNPEHQIRASQVKTVFADQLERELHAPGILVPQRELEDQGWRFEDRRIARLRQKIREAGKPLKEYCGSPLYGIKTGLNEAFVIDQQTRDALIAADPKSAEIFKPFLEGKDLKPWRAQWRGLWLICIPAGWTNATAKTKFKSEKDAFTFFNRKYPAVADWLSAFAHAARKRCDKGDWYWELRPCAYYPEFDKPKIMYPDIVNRPKFVYDEAGLFFGTTVFFIPKADRCLLAVLGSATIWWYFHAISPEIRGGFYRMKTQFMEPIPIAQPPAGDRKKIADLAETLSSEKCSHRMALESELNDRVAALYGLTAEEKRIIAGLVSHQSDEATEDSGDENP